MNHFVLTSAPDLSQFGITKIRCLLSLVKATPVPVSRFAHWLRRRVPSCLAALHPTQRPTVTLISCHALGASLQGI